MSEIWVPIDFNELRRAATLRKFWPEGSTPHVGLKVLVYEPGEGMSIEATVREIKDNGLIYFDLDDATFQHGDERVPDAEDGAVIE